MRTVYIADDGKEFDNEFDCEHHEWMLNHLNLKYVKCYNEDGELFDDIMDDGTYNYSQKIVVPTNLAAKELRDLAEYTGFCYYTHITDSGIWKFVKNGTDGYFKKIDEFK